MFQLSHQLHWYVMLPTYLVPFLVLFHILFFFLKRLLINLKNAAYFCRFTSSVSWLVHNYCNLHKESQRWYMMLLQFHGKGASTCNHCWRQSTVYLDVLRLMIVFFSMMPFQTEELCLLEDKYLADKHESTRQLTGFRTFYGLSP